MSITTYAANGARVVRTVTLGVAFTIVVAVLALQAFQARYGQLAVQVVTRADTQDDARLIDAIEQQAQLGRTCSETPTLTDTVLYQATDSDAVTVITFDEALDDAAAGAGWIRAYCL